MGLRSKAKKSLFVQNLITSDDIKHHLASLKLRRKVTESPQVVDMLVQQGLASNKLLEVLKEKMGSFAVGEL